MSQQILEAIAALADGIRSRDKQWDAVSEQIRLGFEKLENCASADWMQTRTLLDLTNKRLKAIESRQRAKKRKR